MRVPKLTPREKEIVRLASLGCTRIEIGKILKIAPPNGRPPQGAGHGEAWDGQGGFAYAAGDEIESHEYE